MYARFLTKLNALGRSLYQQLSSELRTARRSNGRHSSYGRDTEASQRSISFVLGALGGATATLLAIAQRRRQTTSADAPGVVAPTNQEIQRRSREREAERRGRRRRERSRNFLGRFRFRRWRRCGRRQPKRDRERQARRERMREEGRTNPKKLHLGE